MLGDADVERVVRQVVLQKKEEMKPVLETLLDRASGEINRHLISTKIAPGDEDRPYLVPDYPLLPVRRRFWEAVLRAVDTQGTAGQLRTQLQVVQAANRAVAEQPLGHVVGGDDIFERLRADLLQGAVLLSEQDRVISGLRDGTAEGALKSRLCALAFIIGRLPAPGSGPAATGVRATTEMLADLLVEDLTGGDPGLRGRVEQALDELVTAGHLMLVDDEYRLQTQEGSQWDQAFRQKQQRALGDTVRLNDERARLLRAAVEARLNRMKLVQGASKTPREIELHFGQEAPPTTSGKVPVWVRDGWSAGSEKAVREDARADGTGSPVVFVYLPQLDPMALREALAATIAAEETINERGAPTSDDGRQARAAMQSRQEAAEERRRRLIEDVLDKATVYQGGGHEVSEAGLAAAVQRAAEASLARLFPEFDRADHDRWGNVLARALAGAGDALTNLGYQGDPADHPVLRELRAHVGGGKKGSEVREHFRRPPYGWSQDAIDAALVVNTGAGLVRASRNGKALTAKEITKQALPAVDFVSEEIVVSKFQMIELRGLVSELGRKADDDLQVRHLAPVVVRDLITLAGEAGGPSPLPGSPSTEYLRDLLDLQGNAQLVQLHANADRLRQDAAAWKLAKERIAVRLPRWERLQRLLAQGAGMSAIAELRPRVEAIAENGSLLADPDPLPPLANAVGAALRQRLKEGREQFQRTRRREIARLEATPEWTKLPDAVWDNIIQSVDLSDLPAPEVGTDDQLLAALEAMPFTAWRDRTEALPVKTDRARAIAAKQLEPKVVTLKAPPATLTSPAEVEAYLDQLRALVLEHIEAGRPVAL